MIVWSERSALRAQRQTHISVSTGLLNQPGDVSTWNGPYLKGEGLPLDPWSRPYVYREPSNRPDHEYDLCSRGPDPQAGDSGLICNP